MRLLGLSNIYLNALLSPRNWGLRSSSCSHSVSLWSGVFSVDRHALHICVLPIVNKCLFIGQCPVIRSHIFLSSSLHYIWVTFCSIECWKYTFDLPATSLQFSMVFVISFGNLFDPWFYLIASLTSYKLSGRMVYSLRCPDQLF